MARVDMDMDYDPEDDIDDESVSGTGRSMVWFGWFAMAALFSWDFFGSSHPYRWTYAIVGLWMVLGVALRAVEVAYQ